MTLSTRLLLLGGLLSAGLVTLFGWQTLAGQRAAWRLRWTDTVRMDADSVRLRVQAAAADVSRDVRYLSASPLLRLFVAGGGEEARRLVEEDFQAMLAGTPSYFQVRLIGVADEGREIVRIDRTESGVVTVPVPDLQRKGDRDYVREGLALADAAIALSDINLNQERGAISVPHIPTLRATTPVTGADGRRFGLVVINVDLRALWRDILAAMTPGVEVRLINQKGEYVLHPDASARHGLDLGTGITSGSPNAPGPGDDAIVFGQTFDLDARYPLPIRLEVSAPAEVVAGGLRRIQQRALAVTGLAAMGALALVGVMARRITARLQRVSDAIARYSPGEAPDSLPPAGEDEAGVLAGKVRELAERVRDDRARIDGARRQAEEAVRAKDEFLAVMSHEIRTPLNAVSGLLRVLESNRPAPHQEPILTSMRAAANNLLALVNNALDYSRLKAGRMELTPGPFSPSALLEQIRLTYEPLARLKNLAFAVDFDEALPPRLTGDAVRIAQILGNLVSNAVKFTSSGEVELAADWEESAGTPGRLRLRVSDTGVGIAPENLSRIFAPYEQAPEGKGLAHDGAGLGLAITQGLVSAMGGELSVSSQPGQGSRFSVVLPLAVVEVVEPPPLDEPRPPSSSPEFAGLRVLYVEDVDSNQWVMDSCLAGSGAEVTHASDAVSALALASARSFDVLLLDLQLPDRSGLVLAPDLRALQPAACSLAVTASVSEPLAAQVRHAGMRAVVTKPVDRDLLLAAMREALLNPADIPEPDLPNLRATLGHDPARWSRLCAQLAVEFREYHRELASCPASECAERVRRIRHKLTSAASLLRLDALHSMLDRLAEPPVSGSPGVLRERVLAWLAHYAAWFEQRLPEKGATSA